LNGAYEARRVEEANWNFWENLVNAYSVGALQIGQKYKSNGKGGFGYWTDSGSPDTGYSTYFNFVTGKMEVSINVGGSNSTWTQVATWVNVATFQYGVKEATGNNDGANVDKYLASAGLAGSKLPWCGCFVNWAMQSVGIKGPEGPAGALNWRKFGQSLNKPAWGSLGTLKRPGGGHVGFVVANDADRSGWVIMLGGNQSDAVSYRSFPISIMQFNYPSGYVPSYTLPSMSNIPKGVRMQ